MSEDAGTPALPPPGGAAAEPKRLRRSRGNRWVTGVCGGLAEYFGLHPAVYRIIFAALALAGGTGILLYAAAALVIPAEGSDDSVAAQALREHRQRPWLVIGMALFALALIALLSDGHLFWPLSGGVWVLAVAGGLVVWWDVAHRDRRAARAGGSAPEAPAGRSYFWPGAGALVAAVGLLALLQALDVADLDWRFALAGGMILAGGFFALASRWRGLAALGFLTMALAVGTATGLAAADLPWGGGVGDRVERPVLAAELGDRYRLSVGSLQVDLSGLTLRPGETHLSTSVAVGSLEVDVPRGVAVEVRGRVEGGRLEILGQEDDGVNVSREVADPGFARARTRLVLDAEVGLGNLEVRRG
jgi:phage shock protein PspC (stress-responsive transcriptional regulator)